MTNRVPQQTLQTYPIRTVCALTGLNPITLRAWERRYGFIKPIRTPGGHWMYTQEHVDQINRAMAMLERGTSIGSAARALRGTTAPLAGTNVWMALRTQVISAIVRFDEAALDAIYESALTLQPIEAVTRKLFVPVLEELGRRWEWSEGRVAEEHFFTTYTRNKLGARLHHRRRVATPFRLMCACAPGEQHELGLLLFALAAHDNNLGCVLLGADMPMEELAAACTRARCDGIAISMSMKARGAWLEHELPQLVAKLGKPVFVGGRASAAHSDAIARAKAVAIGADISNGLRQIFSVLSETKSRHPHRSR
jgi:MerR family transcriptional regulator, light-induced transcriptional regulator